MKTIVNILFGIFVGITISSYVLTRTQESKEPSQAQIELVPVKSEEMHSRYVPRQKVKPKKVVKEVPVVKPKVLDLTINEQLVEELEKNWGELRSQIQVSTEKRGFRVNYIAENSPFLQAGLQTGDFISYETLKTMQNSNPEGRELAERVVRIFEYVR